MVTRQSEPVIQVEWTEAQVAVTLREICVCCSTTADFIEDLVSHGVLAPQGQLHGEWLFAAPDVLLVRRALRLRRDFDLNVTGLALALDLLAEVQSLRAALAALEATHPLCRGPD